MKTLRLTVLLALTFALTGPLLGCRKNQNQPQPRPPVETGNGPSAAPEALTKSVVLYKYRFNPNTLTVPAGTTITFQNKDPEQHNVHIKDLSVDQMLRANESFSHTFDRPGTFKVTNRVSSNPMGMTITVR